MSTVKKYIAICMIFSLLLAAMPYGGFISCAHAAGAAQEKAAEDIEPLCPMHAKAETATEKSAPKTLDCCGDFCTCALGNCHAAPAVLAMKYLQSIPFSAASLGIAGLDAPSPFSPELPTPPPKA
ncbi:MAG: hypothetical protein Q8K65_06085 [Alphaproteobacteria bacterium]|nr:hypothetical protein [Alphaproteobacteria bacterium]